MYVHIPFCTRRCDYCAFATWTDQGHLIGRYVAALRTELARGYRLGQLAPATTVYFGGGTPSLLPAAALASVLGEIDTLPGAEVSVECNPESTDERLLAELAEAGVTRISLGVQSTVSHVLRGLGRDEHPGAVERAVRAIGRVGFASYNMDLIYGGAGERDEDWIATLTTVLGYDPSPSHVSAYALSVEAGTPLARDQRRHPDDDVQARRYELADHLLTHAGLGWYEISNWARPGHECRHNLGYWNGSDYRGIGCAAHSHRDGRRSWNVVALERYLERVESGRDPTAGEEVLDATRRAEEALQLQLRTRAGVPAWALSASDRAVLDGTDPLVDEDDGRLVLTLRGRLLANEVACRLRAPAQPASGPTWDQRGIKGHENVTAC